MHEQFVSIHLCGGRHEIWFFCCWCRLHNHRGRENPQLEQKHSNHFKLPDIAGLKLSRAASLGSGLVSVKTLFQTALLQISSCQDVRAITDTRGSCTTQDTHFFTAATEYLHNSLGDVMLSLPQTSLSPGLYSEMIPYSPHDELIPLSQFPQESDGRTLNLTGTENRLIPHTSRRMRQSGTRRHVRSQVLYKEQRHKGRVQRGVSLPSAVNSAAPGAAVEPQPKT